MKSNRRTPSFRPRLEVLEDRLVPATILDDPSASFVGGWVNFNGQGLNNSLHFDAAGAGEKATWTFSGLSPGTYQVAATWTPYTNRATNAPYAVNGGPAIAVNQQLAPLDFNDAGVGWKTLGTFTVTSNSLAVTLGNDANGYVIADAVRISLVNPGAQMYFDLPNHSFYYVGGALNDTLALSHNDGHLTASLTESGQTTTISADGIYNEYVTVGGGVLTATDDGVNVGYSNFFYAQYQLKATASHVTATWNEGPLVFCCAKFVSYATGPAAVQFNNTGFGLASMLTINTLTGDHGSFVYTQSGQNDGRGLTIFAWNEGDYATTTLDVRAHDRASQYVEIVDLGHHDVAKMTVTVDAGDTGSLSYELQGSQAGDDDLTAILNNFSGLPIDAHIDTTTGNPNVHNNGFGVHYYS